VQDELIPFDRLAKLVLEQQSLCDPRVHFRPIEQIRFPRLLGLCNAASAFLNKVSVSSPSFGTPQRRRLFAILSSLSLDGKRCLDDRRDRAVDRIGDVAGITDIRESAGKDIPEIRATWSGSGQIVLRALCELAQQRVPAWRPKVSLSGESD